MKFIKILILIGVIGFSIHWWKKRDTSNIRMAEASPNGFISVAMPDGAAPNAVLILAPVNCPSEVAQRADAMSARLNDLRIPNVRSSSFSINTFNPTEEQNAAIKRSVAVFNGEAPTVFLNGMGKNNPSVDEVVAEYQRTKE